MVEQFGELLAQERGDDGGRSLVGTQTVGVGGTHDAGLEQTVVAVNTHQRLHDEGDETQVVFGSLAGSVEQYAGIGREAPVVMLT